MESPQLQSIVVVDISVIAHWQIPMVVEFLQLQYIDMVVDVGCAGVVHTPVVCNDSCPWSMSSCSSSTWVAVAVMPQRPVPAVGLSSLNEG